MSSQTLSKPVFPEMPKSITELESLCQFVDFSSMLFFEAIECNGRFLQKVSFLFYCNRF